MIDWSSVLRRQETTFVSHVGFPTSLTLPPFQTHKRSLVKVSLGCIVGGSSNPATCLVELQGVIFDWCIQNLWIFEYS